MNVAAARTHAASAHGPPSPSPLVPISDPDFFKQIALRDFKSADIDPRHDRRVPVGIEGNFGPSAVSPRTLAAHFLSTLVKLEGIVTKVSIMKPKLTKSVHFCPKTSKTMNRVYSDVYDLGGLPTAGQMPTQDEDKNPLEQEFGRSVYKDTQTFTIQEMPEAAPCGQLPRSTEVYVEADLICDETVVKPGDRVAIVGIYRAIDRGGGIAGKARFTSAQIKTVLIGNSVQKLKKDAANIILSTEDVSNIKKFSKRSDAFTLLARSLAPSIYGHREVKQALALMLLGGREHNLRNGTHLRGDINILMVGDPSTAKSQLLRFVYNIASNPVQTTGRGSSGVGLTAAVTTDPETGERRLEAGAMVLADRGVVCIDEFDKMSDADRVAIHEVMEQQTVTISKAGIHASLNARCSVVAAANPVYGRFDPTLPLSKNVALPDSLMSRFDVFFVMQDVPSSSRDKRLAGHVLRMHRTVIPGFEGIPLPANIGSRSNDIEDRYKSDARDDERDEKTAVFQKFNPLLHGAAREEMGEDGVDDATAAAERDSLILNLEFMRKYIYYAKSRTPTLTESAREAIVDAYVSFRERVAGRKVAITARSLETLIRLATAHAKSRLSDTVGRQDARVAEGILRFALYGDKAAIAGEVRSADMHAVNGDCDETKLTPPHPAPPFLFQCRKGAKPGMKMGEGETRTRTISRVFRAPPPLASARHVQGPPAKRCGERRTRPSVRVGRGREAAPNDRAPKRPLFPRLALLMRLTRKLATRAPLVAGSSGCVRMTPHSLRNSVCPSQIGRRP